MRDLWTAIALVLVIEGMLWALFPEAMKRMASQVALLDSNRLRFAGLLAVAIGVLAVWIIRG